MAVRYCTIHRWDFFRALQLQPFDNKTGGTLIEVAERGNPSLKIKIRCIMGGLVRSDDKMGGTLIEVAERCTYPTLTTK